MMIKTNSGLFIFLIACSVVLTSCAGQDDQTEVLHPELIAVDPDQPQPEEDYIDTEISCRSHSDCSIDEVCKVTGLRKVTCVKGLDPMLAGSDSRVSPPLGLLEGEALHGPVPGR